jgi:hypothetical protein
MPGDSEDQKKGIIGEIAENLGALFRHLLPGALIIGVARITHPSWFTCFDSSSWSFLAVVGVIAFAVGNAWFSLNRYIIHQFIDYICWHCKLQGPAKDDHVGYFDHLAKYVREPLLNRDVPERARQHVAFRASSVLLIYTLSELSLLAAVWSEGCALTSGSKPRILLLAGFAVLFVAGVWQNIITRRIDAAVLHQNLVP